MLGLARSAAAADTLARLGVEAHRGELSDTDSLAAGARACEGLIDAAFIQDFSAYAAAADLLREAAGPIRELQSENQNENSAEI
jgi:hypothetical protein